MRGPRPNETERFRYESASDPGIFHYCRFCPKRALEDSTYNYMQITSCLKNYPKDVKWTEVLTAYEWKEKKFPFCNEGETPGCEALPNIENIKWECERGYSGEFHSVYFPCSGVCNITNEVYYHAYCNASFEWEFTDVRNGSPHCEVRSDTFIEVPEGGSDNGLIIGLSIGAAIFVVGVLVVAICCVCRKRKKLKKKEDAEGNDNGIEMKNFAPADGNRHQGQNVNRGPCRPLAGGQGDPEAQGRHALDVIEEAQVQGARQKAHLNGNLDTKMKKVKNVNARQAVDSRNESLTSNLQRSNSQTFPKVVGSSQTILDSGLHDRDFVTVESEDMQKSLTDVSDSKIPVKKRNSDLGKKSSVRSQGPLARTHTFTVKPSNNIQTSSLDSPGSEGTVNPHSLGQLALPGAKKNNLNKSDKPSSSKTTVTTSSSQTGQEEFSLPIASHGSSSRNHPSYTDNDHYLLHGQHMEYNVFGEDGEDAEELDEKSNLLPEEETSYGSRPVGERTRLLCGGSDRDRLNSEQIRLPSLDGGSSTGSSLKEPCEHELPLEEEVGQRDWGKEDEIEERVKPDVKVMSKGCTQDEDNKFHVTKGEPFTVVAKPGCSGFTLERKDSGVEFRGIAIIPNCPALLHINRADPEDAGMFTWSLLSERGEVRGEIEIVVEDKDDEKQRLNPIGASANERTVEVRVEATVQDKTVPTDPLVGAPTLNIDSVLNDNLSQQTQQTPSVCSACGESFRQRCGMSQSGSDDRVKGEISDKESRSGESCGGFNILDRDSFANRFDTREGPSGLSTLHVSDREGSDCLHREEEETKRKSLVEVDTPNSCCLRFRDTSEKLRAKLAQHNHEHWKAFAQQWGLDESFLMALKHLKEEDSEVVLNIIEFLGGLGLRLGHVLQYFCRYCTNRDSVIEIIRRDHSDCPFCRNFLS